MKNAMKNTKKGILMVTMFATLLSFANDAPFYIIKNEANRTSLTLTDVKQGNLLSIIDNNGMVLYKETIQETGIYTKGFDLTALPNGNYIFELNKDLEINTIPFSVLSNEVTFNKELEKTIFKPFTRVKGNLVYLTKLALNEAPLKVEIYFIDNDLKSELIYSETIKNTMHINRVYKLSGLKHGDYKIVYNTDGRVFTNDIKN
ncbi:hypothetical protein [Mariniflexile sp.]|uniref:hypothetical protein n=1 Tax=Mariniflexile sp. TaxID=1979402 RepID=UPI0040488C00